MENTHPESYKPSTAAEGLPAEMYAQAEALNQRANLFTRGIFGAMSFGGAYLSLFASISQWEKVAREGGLERILIATGLTVTTAALTALGVYLVKPIFSKLA